MFVTVNGGNLIRRESTKRQPHLAITPKGFDAVPNSRGYRTGMSPGYCSPTLLRTTSRTNLNPRGQTTFTVRDGRYHQ